MSLAVVDGAGVHLGVEVETLAGVSSNRRTHKPVELRGLHELAQLVEVSVCSPGKTTIMRCELPTTWMVLRMRSISLRRYQPFAPRSCAQHWSARVLQRHVDVFSPALLVLGNGIEQLLRDLIGIRIEEANPFFVRRFDLCQAGQQLRQPVLSPKSSP